MRGKAAPIAGSFPDHVCGAVDADGMDDCGLIPRHRGRHYSLDPAGPFARARPCLACGKRTEALACVCAACRKAGVDPARAREAAIERQRASLDEL